MSFFPLNFIFFFSDLGGRNNGRGQLEVSRRQPIQVKVGEIHVSFLKSNILYLLLTSK